MCEKRPNEPWLAYMCRYVVEQPRAVLAVIGIAAAIVLYCDLRSFIAEQAEAQEKTIRRAVRDVCPLADHRAPDGGIPHAAASGDEAISTSGMTAKEDKKTLRLRQGFAETGCKRWTEASAHSCPALGAS